MNLKSQLQLNVLEGVKQIECWIGFFVGLAFLAFTVFTEPLGGMSVTAWRCAGMGTLMAIWWSTEAIPIPATALLPIVLIPLLGLGSIKVATTPYANPTIYLFLGGFMLGLAMEKWNLHKRIALSILNYVGVKPGHQIAGFMIATAFISMWVSNTATAIMMAPIGISVSHMVTNGADTPEAKRFSCALLLSVAYAASLGGIATLIGTPPNALLVAFLAEHYQVHVGFGQWMLLGLPVSIVMLSFTWWWLTRHPFHFDLPETDNALHDALHNLGPITRPEKMVALVFGSAALCWVFQPLIATVFPKVDDTIIAMAAGLSLFVIPTNGKEREFLLDWSQASRLPWGILILFGGGLSLAGVIGSSGLAQWFGDGLRAFGTLHVIVMMLLVVAAITFLTEVTSNTATAAAFLPLVGTMAVAQGVAPEMYAIPAAIAASCAFMLPVSTPPNAIVFASGEVPISTMIRTGFALNLFGIMAVTGLCYLIVTLIWLA